MSRKSGSVQHSMQGVFVFVLLGLFALMSTLMVLLGAQRYRGTVDRSTANNDDRVLGAQAAVDLAEALNYPCYIYEGYGHGVYDEAPDYLARIAAFLKGE